MYSLCLFVGISLILLHGVPVSAVGMCARKLLQTEIPGLGGFACHFSYSVAVGRSLPRGNTTLFLIGAPTYQHPVTGFLQGSVVTHDDVLSRCDLTPATCPQCRCNASQSHPSAPMCDAFGPRHAYDGNVVYQELDGEDWFGQGVALGDIDGDGDLDAAVGAPATDGLAVDEGMVYVIILNADGTAAAFQPIGRGKGGLEADFPLGAGDYFGSAVAFGDIDGDPAPDLVVGAYECSTVAFKYGAVFVLFLNQQGQVANATAYVKITAGLGGLPPGFLEPGDKFGYSVAVGDIDGDGVPDLAVGAPARSTYGVVFVLFLNRQGRVANTTAYAELTKGLGGFDPSELRGGDDFGTSVALGDVDGDGVPDLLVGAAHFDTIITSEIGAIFVLFLNRQGRLAGPTAYVIITAGFGGLTTDFPLRASDLFGTSVALGDMDDNGVPDALVGTATGALYFLSLTKVGTVSETCPCHIPTATTSLTPTTTATATLPLTGSRTVSGTRSATAPATLPLTGSRTVSGTRSETATATLPLTGSRTVSGTRSATATATATLPLTGSRTVSGTRSATATATLPLTGSPSATGSATNESETLSMNVTNTASSSVTETSIVVGTATPSSRGRGFVLPSKDPDLKEVISEPRVQASGGILLGASITGMPPLAIASLLLQAKCASSDAVKGLDPVGESLEKLAVDTVQAANVSAELILILICYACMLPIIALIRGLAAAFARSRPSGMFLSSVRDRYVSAFNSLPSLWVSVHLVMCLLALERVGQMMFCLGEDHLRLYMRVIAPIVLFVAGPLDFFVSIIVVVAMQRSAIFVPTAPRYVVEGTNLIDRAFKRTGKWVDIKSCAAWSPFSFPVRRLGFFFEDLQPTISAKIYVLISSLERISFGLLFGMTCWPCCMVFSPFLGISSVTALYTLLLRPHTSVLQNYMAVYSKTLLVVAAVFLTIAGCSTLDDYSNYTLLSSIIVCCGIALQLLCIVILALRVGIKDLAANRYVAGNLRGRMSAGKAFAAAKTAGIPLWSLYDAICARREALLRDKEFDSFHFKDYMRGVLCPGGWPVGLNPNVIAAVASRERNRNKEYQNVFGELRPFEWPSSVGFPNTNSVQRMLPEADNAYSKLSMCVDTSGGLRDYSLQLPHKAEPNDDDYVAYIDEETDTATMGALMLADRRNILTSIASPHTLPAHRDRSKLAQNACYGNSPFLSAETIIVHGEGGGGSEMDTGRSGRMSGLPGPFHGEGGGGSDMDTGRSGGMSGLPGPFRGGGGSEMDTGRSGGMSRLPGHERGLGSILALDTRASSTHNALRTEDHPCRRTQSNKYTVHLRDWAGGPSHVRIYTRGGKLVSQYRLGGGA